MPDICLDLQDVITSVALPPCFTSSKISTLLWIIGMVVSCCDATSNVLITSFWSHCQAHPCILWRSKLRNTYCTLNFAKYCFRILSWNARLNVSIFFPGGPFYQLATECLLSTCTHTDFLNAVEVDKLLLSKFLEWSDRWRRDSLPPSHYPVLDEAFRTRLPGLFGIAVYCMSIYQWVFFPKLLKEKSRREGWLKRLDVSIFHELFT